MNYPELFLNLLLQLGCVDRIMFSADYPYQSMQQARAFLDQIPSPPPTGRASPTATRSGCSACDIRHIVELIVEPGPAPVRPKTGPFHRTGMPCLH